MQLNIDGYDVTIKAKYYGFGKSMERHAEDIVFMFCLLADTAARYYREHGDGMLAEGAERVYRDLSAAVYKNRTWQS